MKEVNADERWELVTGIAKLDTVGISSFIAVALLVSYHYSAMKPCSTSQPGELRRSDVKCQAISN